ncbi:MAG TPA: pyridoxamine 5'-phosphate oxidase family protein [Caulobacteraceae bacterium]|jgi:general stress protein 26
MSTDVSNPADVEHLLWDEIEKHHIGMLILTGGSPRHAQPMAAFVERGRRQLWFFGDSASEMGKAIGDKRTQLGMFIWQQGDVRACIGGQIAVQHDRERIDRYWNPMVAAWYPKGKTDPKLTLYVMDCEDAEVWISTAGPIRAVWEVARANATGKTPELGAQTHLDLN